MAVKHVMFDTVKVSKDLFKCIRVLNLPKSVNYAATNNEQKYNHYQNCESLNSGQSRHCSYKNCIK